MQTDYEAALQAARERVVSGCNNKAWCTTRPDAEQRIDYALRLARAIGAAEAMPPCTTPLHANPPSCDAQRLQAEVDAIIREMEGA